MMKEIGSEFWTSCTPITREEYTMRPNPIYGAHPYKVAETLSGRTALEHVVEILVKQGKAISYLPSYCCHTMIEPFLTHGMEVKFYDINLSSSGLSRVINRDDYDAILMMDYFGHIDKETIGLARREKASGKTVIYDATHSMYSDINVEPYDIVYGSYRKWVDINCGFLAWKEGICEREITQNDNNYKYASIRQELFDKKALYMQGGTVKKEEFLPLIKHAETILEEQYHHKMPDERSMKVLRTADTAYVKTRRRKNARVLTEAINDIHDERIRCINPTLNFTEVPLFVPVIVAPEIRNSLRKYLIEHMIYCPIHWPLSDLHSIMPGSKQLFESELSLICDQRYDTNDMKRIVDTIKQYLKS